MDEETGWFCSRPWTGCEVNRYYRPYMIGGRGFGMETVQWSARRKSRPKVHGYGMTAEEAIHDLVEHVQPLFHYTYGDEPRVDLRRLRLG